MGAKLKLKRTHLMLLGLFLVASVLFGLAYELRYRGRFYPGVVLGGEAVGGKAYGEVMTLFKDRADALAASGFNLLLEGERGQKEVAVPVFSNGLTADSLVSYFSFGNWEDAVWQAYQWGRDGSIFQRAAGQIAALLTGKEIALPAAANDGAIRSLLFREVKNFFREAAPAQFTWDGLAIVILPEKSGEDVGYEDIVAAIRGRLASFDSSPIILKARVAVPEVTAVKLQPFLKLANDVAESTSLIFYYQQGRWRVSGRTLAAWLTIKPDAQIGIDGVKLERFLAKTVAPLIDDPPRNSRFEVRAGKLVEILPGRPGNVVDVQKTAEWVEKVVYRVQKSYALTGNLLLAVTSATAQTTVTVQGGNIEIPIEITRAEPAITQKTIDEYRIRDLIGFAKTSFKGSSADRRKNIEVGVSKFNGVLLAPGEEFSAVKAIGDTTEEAGFVKEFVIKENKSVKELGGGLCQVATTLFRLALDTGLPITDRTNHRYVVSYYGPGLDATIYGPRPDLRFVNDTGNYLLLQGKVEGDELSFEFYGQRDGRFVQISDPVLTNEIPAPEIKYLSDATLPYGQVKCSETPHKGVTADVTYSVRYPGGETKEQQFHSIYQPWQKICLVGTVR